MGVDFLYERREASSWEDGRGTRWKAEDMNTPHLNSCISLLERNALTMKMMHDIAELKKPMARNILEKFKHIELLRISMSIVPIEWLRRHYKMYRLMKIELQKRQLQEAQAYAGDRHVVEAMHHLVQYHLAHGATEAELLRAMAQVAGMGSSQRTTSWPGWSVDERPEMSEELYMHGEY